MSGTIVGVILMPRDDDVVGQGEGSMYDIILSGEMNADRVRELRSAGCRRCVRVRSRWAATELRALTRRR